MNIVNKVVSFIHRSQPGAWNDLDMLEVGNGMQEDSEYVVHMTLWAALKSPLIMGNDIRIIDAPSYSILTNPAILALSQDPLGSSAQRIWRYHVYPDQYGQGDIQLWSGPLAQGDQVVLLLNAANQDLYMNATLAEIFVDQGGAKSDEAQSDWDVYDLWANRMPDAKANEILAANSTEGVAGLEQWYYNSTAMSYEDGIFANHTLLMGTHVDSVPAGGKVSALVPRHSIKAYRLRMAGSPVTKVKRDEL
jgi:alpha-galactosidase